MNQSEGLKLARFMMVLSSLSPLFILWGLRGVHCLPDKWLWWICGVLIVIPNAFLGLRLWIAKRQGDSKILVIGQADDHRDHLLVYLFAMLIPLYDANIGAVRDVLATAGAFVFIVFLFWHLNLHYMNVLFALFGYKVFTIRPPSDSGIGGDPVFVLLTKRDRLTPNLQIQAHRLSNTVFFELEKKI